MQPRNYSCCSSNGTIELIREGQLPLHSPKREDKSQTTKTTPSMSPAQSFSLANTSPCSPFLLKPPTTWNGRFQATLLLLLTLANKSVVSAFQILPLQIRTLPAWPSLEKVAPFPKRSSIPLSMVATSETTAPSQGDVGDFPELGPDGLYHIPNGEQHK